MTSFLLLDELDDDDRVGVAQFIQHAVGPQSGQARLLGQVVDGHTLGVVALKNGRVAGIAMGKVARFGQSPDAHVAPVALRPDSWVGAVQTLLVRPGRGDEATGHQLVGKLIDALLSADIEAVVGIVHDDLDDGPTRRSLESNGFKLLSQGDASASDQAPPAALNSAFGAADAHRDRVLLYAKAAPAPWTVYLLRCRDGSLYCGITNRLQRRLSDHNAKRGARYTRSRTPVEVVWMTQVATKSEALRLEYALKQHSRAEKERLIAGIL